MLNNYKKMYIFDALLQLRRDSSVNQSGRASIICSLKITRIALKRNQTFKIYIFLRTTQNAFTHIIFGIYIILYVYSIYIYTYY